MAYNVLICDLVGMRLDPNGVPDHAQTQIYIQSKGGEFHLGLPLADETYAADKIHFFYQPDLSTEQQLLAATADGQFDAVIAAATYIPQQAKFALGGVRIGAGTGNMGSASWGGGNGIGGAAPLMNTPSFNARATAQMAMKALLQVLPDLDVQTLHDRVVAKNFDTGKNLVEYPTAKLQSKKIAILGYGNIGREMAKLAKAFSMQVTVYARHHHMQWILSEGFNYAATPFEAAIGADVISPHLG
ncbi:MAG: phosphoglycerate dehydrogenase, partial [Algicola sp.]|nr:phosphoglycerate dehydrogenase [Algicola sp.]